MAPCRVLALAASSGRIGYICLQNSEIISWGMSRKASRNPALAVEQAKIWIDKFKPDVVVTEKLEKGCRKGVNTKALIEAVNVVAANENLFDVSVTRPRSFKNKYEEAAALAERFPVLQPWVPQRKIWDSEPRHTTLFEALALALAVIERNYAPQKTI